MISKSVAIFPARYLPAPISTKPSVYNSVSQKYGMTAFKTFVNRKLTTDFCKWAGFGSFEANTTVYPENKRLFEGKHTF